MHGPKRIQWVQIESKVLAETRTYVIHTPDYYNNGKEAYPVLVLQDAENNFAYTSAAVHLLSANGRIPAMIVVGINNTDRLRDMTPTKPETGFGGTPWTGSAGEASKFLSFIADELLPTIDRTYRTRQDTAESRRELSRPNIKNRGEKQ